MADELVQLRCGRVTLTGGEPTLRQDWDVLGERLAWAIALLVNSPAVNRSPPDLPPESVQPRGPG